MSWGGFVIMLMARLGPLFALDILEGEKLNQDLNEGQEQEYSSMIRIQPTNEYISKM